MRLALQEAKEAFHQQEVPVGAVVVLKGQVIGSAHNACEALRDPTAHAEILAIQRACRALGTYRLVDADLYVTVEPCCMCAGAVHLARVKRVIYGCRDEKGGAMGPEDGVHVQRRFNHKLDVIGGVLEDECKALMRSFFKGLRRKGFPGVGEMAESG